MGVQQVDIRFAYAYGGTGTFPWDNSTSNVVGMYEIYGAGFSY